MVPEFNGIERHLDELSERLARLTPLKAKSHSEFLNDFERFADFIRQWLKKR